MIQIMRGKSQPRANNTRGKLPFLSAARSTEFAKTIGQNTWTMTFPVLLSALPLLPIESTPKPNSNSTMAYSRRSLLRRTNDR
jgi:hypothetical protein